MEVKVSALIDSYEFGSISIDGRVYTSDVIISPDGVDDSWWRKSGHQLCLADIAAVMESAPDVLIVGTGAYGALHVLPEVVQVASQRGVKLIVEITDEAWRTYNALAPSRRVVAALHLTC